LLVEELLLLLEEIGWERGDGRDLVFGGVALLLFACVD